MGLRDWLRSVYYPQEQVAPAPKKVDPLSPDNPKAVPLGAPTEVEPLSDKDRQRAFTQSALTAQERGRAARYALFERMDTGDIAVMIDTVVDAALTWEDPTQDRGVKITFPKRNQQKLVEEITKRVKLNEQLDEWARDLVKYGDSFIEPIYIGQDLVDVQPYDTTTITSNRDDKGKLSKAKDDDGFNTAFQQKRAGKVVAGWQPWEMIHGKWQPSRKKVYSVKSMLDDIILDWKKLQVIELGMVIARITRAYPRRNHYIDLTGKNTVDQEKAMTSYIRRMTQVSFGTKPRDEDGLPTVESQQDLFLATGYRTGPDNSYVPSLSRVELEDPSLSGIGNHDDIDYLRKKVWSLVPGDVVGMDRQGGDINGQDLAFARTLRKLQQRLEKMVRAVIDQALLARGVVGAEYEVLFPTINTGASWKWADARFRDSLTLRNYLELGAMSRREALKRAYGLSDTEIDRIWEEVKEELEMGIFTMTNNNGRPADPEADPEAKPGDTGKAPIKRTGNGVPTNTPAASQMKGNNSA